MDEKKSERVKELEAMVELQNQRIKDLEFRNTSLAIENRVMDEKVRTANKAIYDSIASLETARFEASTNLLVSSDPKATLTNICDRLMVIERNLLNWE